MKRKTDLTYKMDFMAMDDIFQVHQKVQATSTVGYKRWQRWDVVIDKEGGEAWVELEKKKREDFGEGLINHFSSFWEENCGQWIKKNDKTC